MKGSAPQVGLLPSAVLPSAVLPSAVLPSGLLQRRRLVRCGKRCGRKSAGLAIAQFAVLGTLLLSARALSAQTAPQPSAPTAPLTAPTAAAVAATPVAVEVVVTGTRSPESAQRSVLHTGRVTRAEAERRGAVNVAEALATEPGVQVQSSIGNAAGVQLHGMDAERVLVLVDGERSVGDAAGVTDLAQFSLAGVERIEYVLGPGSAVYGAGALGGVINIVRAPPRSDGLSGHARVDVRSVPESNALVEAGYRQGGWWLAPAAQGFWGASVPLVAHGEATYLPERRRAGLGLRAGYLADTSSSTVDVRYTHTRVLRVMVEERPGLGQYVIDLPDNTQRWEARVRQQWQPREEWKHELSLNGQWFTGSAGKDRRQSPLDEVRDRFQNLYALESSTTYQDQNRLWLLGVRAEHEAFEQQLLRYEPIDGAPQEVIAQEVEPLQLWNGAVYGQVLWPLDERWTLVPGVRAEWHRRAGVVAAPRLASVLALSERLRLRLSGGRGFRVPSAKEYGFLFDHTALGYVLLGNPELKSETSWGITADVSWTVTPVVRVTLSAFHNWVYQLITTRLLPRESAAVDRYSYENVARARTWGGDVGVTWKLAPRVQTQLTYSYLGTLNQESDFPLAGRTPHVLLSALAYAPWDGTRLSVRQRTSSATFVREDLAYAPAFSLLDVNLAQRVAKFLEVQVGVFNLLDAKDDPYLFGDLRPATGRVVFAALTADYEPSLD